MPHFRLNGINKMGLLAASITGSKDKSLQIINNTVVVVQLEEGVGADWWKRLLEL